MTSLRLDLMQGLCVQAPMLASQHNQFDTTNSVGRRDTENTQHSILLAHLLAAFLPAERAGTHVHLPDGRLPNLVRFQLASGGRACQCGKLHFLDEKNVWGCGWRACGCGFARRDRRLVWKRELLITSKFCHPRTSTGSAYSPSKHQHWCGVTRHLC